MAQVWKEVVEELRYRWENSHIIPKYALSHITIHTFCTVHKYVRKCVSAAYTLGVSCASEASLLQRCCTHKHVQDKVFLGGRKLELFLKLIILFF